MAGSGGSPYDLSEEKYYINDSRRKVATVICIICENAYHETYFEKLKQAVRLSKVLGVCPDHQQLDIISKEAENTLTIAARKIIAQIKLNEKEKAHEEILLNVSQQVGKENVDRCNLTIVGNEEDDFTILKSEIVLLRQLNVEMQDKNNVLKELIKEKNEKIVELKQKHIGEIVTYAEITKKSEDKIKHVPSIIVTSKKDKNKPKTSRAVKNSLINDTVIPINKVQDQRDGSVKIKCASMSDVAKLEEQLVGKLNSDFIVKREEILNPRLKISGIENDMEIEELEADIIHRNFGDTNLSCNVEHVFKNKKTNTQCAIITLARDAYDIIRANNYKVYIGHQCLKSFDDLNITPCYNCGRIGHSGKKCNNTTTCLRCAGNHATEDCDGNRPIQCTNCCYGKEKFHDDRDIQHFATDTEKCNYLKIMIKKKINSTDYSVTPNIPKFFGFNGNLRKQTKITKEPTNRLSRRQDNQEENKQAASSISTVEGNV